MYSNRVYSCQTDMRAVWHESYMFVWTDKDYVKWIAEGVPDLPFFVSQAWNGFLHTHLHVFILLRKVKYFIFLHKITENIAKRLLQ